MKSFPAKLPLMALVTWALTACSSGDPLLVVFAEVNDGALAGNSSCSTTCTVSLYPDLEKTTPVVQSSATTPQGCDGGFNLIDQTWQVADFNIGNSNLCAQFGTNNPTEILCVVNDGNTVVNTYLGVGEFPFVPQGCDRAGLDLTIFVDNLLTLPDTDLAGFSCDTLEQAYADNVCDPIDNSNPVCAALNGLVANGLTNCNLIASP